MKVRALALVEVTAYAEENDTVPVMIRYRKAETGDRYQAIADVIESQFVFSANGTPTLIRMRARGLRVEQRGDSLTAVGRMEWMDLDIAEVPDGLQPLHREMTAEAVVKWKEAREAK
jgi:hypothetical protein